MSNEFVVLHYQGGNSDKIWAVHKVANADNSHTVWFGRRGSKLQSKNVGYKKWFALVQDKLDKGYREIENVTINSIDRVVVPFSRGTEEGGGLPTALWYRISNQISKSLIRDYLNITLHLVSDICAEELERLVETPTYQALYAGKMSGGADYAEGPLALLLLFGLRRYLNDVAGAQVSAEVMQIADDANEFLSERFASIKNYLWLYCASFLDAKGWTDAAKSAGANEYVNSVASEHNLSHYTSLAGIKHLAIAMGCIDAPIDLTGIRSETKAAFF